MFWPCETRTSTCRSFATISSGLYRFLAIAVLLDVKDIPQVGPLQWGWISGECVCGLAADGSDVKADHPQRGVLVAHLVPVFKADAGSRIVPLACSIFSCCVAAGSVSSAFTRSESVITTGFLTLLRGKF